MMLLSLLNPSILLLLLLLQVSPLSTSMKAVVVGFMEKKRNR
ncbi:hypothetical protein Hanom_Chr06g00521951 [Helianthus anomalus]